VNYAHGKYCVKNQYVRAEFDLYCKYKIGTTPSYRIYVNGELFAERTWTHDLNQHLTYMLQIDAPPGTYRVEIEAVNAPEVKFRRKGQCVPHGFALWVDQDTLRIG